MKNLKSVALSAAIALFGAVSSQAATVLTFEGLGNGNPGNYYNGGAGGNYGITFGVDSLVLTSGNYSNNPSGTNILFFLSGPGDVMNVAAGFTTGFSFFYADQVGFTGSVDVYSGLNGTGSLLASLSLPSTPNPYTVWVPVGVTFAGTAQSVIFGGAADFIGFDDITLGSATAGDVPESGATLALFGLALSGFALLKRKVA